MKDENVYSPKIANGFSARPFMTPEQEIASSCVVIGRNSTSAYSNCVLIGHDLKSDHPGQVKIGNTEIQASGEITPEQVQTIIDAFLGIWK